MLYQSAWRPEEDEFSFRGFICIQAETTDEEDLLNDVFGGLFYNRGLWLARTAEVLGGYRCYMHNAQHLLRRHPGLLSEVNSMFSENVAALAA